MRNKRNEPGYKEFRFRVLSRDNYTCQMPGCGNQYRRWLQVHHIVKYSTAYRLRQDINNAITLCYGCHKSITNVEERYEKLFREIVLRNTK